MLSLGNLDFRRLFTDVHWESLWQTFNNVAHVLVGMFIVAIIMPSFTLKYWLTIQRIRHTKLDQATDHQLENLTPWKTIIDFFCFPNSWAWYVGYASATGIWIWVEKPSVVHVCTMIVFTPVVTGMIRSILGYALGWQDVKVRFIQDHPLIGYTQNTHQVATDLLASVISFGAFAYRFRILEGLCVSFILSKYLIHLPQRRDSAAYVARVSLQGAMLMIIAISIGGFFPLLRPQKQWEPDEEAAWMITLDEYIEVMLGFTLSYLWGIVIQVICICYRFDYQVQVSTESLEDKLGEMWISGSFFTDRLEIATPRISNQENGVGTGTTTSSAEASIGAPLQKAAKFTLKYYKIALQAWIIGSLVTTWVMSVAPEKDRTAVQFSLLNRIISSWTIFIALNVVSVRRGECKKLWRYREEWILEKSEQGQETQAQATSSFSESMA